MEGPVRTVATPEEELAYLHEQIALKERELAQLKQERPRALVAHERVLEHKEADEGTVLAPEYRLTQSEREELALNLDPDDNDATMEELRVLLETKGIKNALSVVEGLGSDHIADDFHRFLVQYLVAGMPVKGFSEGSPEWRALHMTLYEVALPEYSDDDETRGRSFKELVSSMEQLYASLLAVEDAYANEPPYFTFELAVPSKRPYLTFYAAVPNGRADLFEKQVHAIFPEAHVTPQPNDYNVFVEGGVAVASEAAFAYPPMLSLKDYADFDYDPLNAVLQAFAKIAPEDEGAAIQFVIRPQGDRFMVHYRRVLDMLRQGASRSKALSLPESMLKEAVRDLGSELFGSKKRSPEAERLSGSEANKIDIEQIEKKTSSIVVGTNIRLIASSATPTRASQILSELESAFLPFTNPHGNKLKFTRLAGNKARALMRDFTYRLFVKGSEVALSLRELTALYHYPPKGMESTPHLTQTRSVSSPVPLGLPQSGIALGMNEHRGAKTMVHFADADRLRHLYVIGQTGTGKTGFLKTLIEQDIRSGNGVCFIDPHGNDILDVLASIPPERYEDVIYFDPAYIDRPFGLNLLEYDPAHPEQKTFIVNELLAIFRRLYGDVPESMGPAFEQYFRNAALLVMEDPATGSTLMDIGRALSNASFRELKLSRSFNPVVNQFWKEIATQAGGEAALENIVPYITNKFDDFTANDFMRPIIGQQQSSFNFRDVMDSKKILLVNLSKGRLGERNANLLGLILVGKLFMAALSRADNPRADYPPFYLYIDEFQNITTDSIPGILSEARKYKLSLTIAHQFLAQIDPKIKDAVFGNVGSLAAFRVGEEDGEYFAKQFAPVFDARDFVNIENRNALVRMLAGGVPQKPFNIRTLDLQEGNLAQVDDLRELSYLTYGRDRATVEESIRARYLA